MMELKPNAGSDRAWVWNTHADFADECPKPELLAIRFLNAESKQKSHQALGYCFSGRTDSACEKLVGGTSLTLLSGALSGAGM